MKTILRTTVAGLALASLGIASAASAATADADARAEILAALTVTLDGSANALDFGSIADSGSGGTVTLAPGATAPTGSCAPLLCVGPHLTPNFDVVGQPGATVNISLTNTNITLTSGGNSMPVSLQLSDASIVLDNTTGQGDFDVGGTLTVAANQPVGTYTNLTDLIVNVVYN